LLSYKSMVLEESTKLYIHNILLYRNASFK
jgi:hypothetical protein